MEILMNVWLTFNVVFGLWTGRNLLIRTCCMFMCKRYTQSGLGKFIDLFVLVSILAYYFSI